MSEASAAPAAPPAPATDAAPGPRPVDRAAGTREGVPAGLRTVAGWSWRILVIVALAAVVVLVVARLQMLFVSIFMALLLTALLQPGAALLRRLGLSSGLATAGVLLVALAMLFGVLFQAVRSIVDQFDDVTAALSEGLDQVRAWTETTLGLSLAQAQARATDLLPGAGSGDGEGDVIASSAFSVASTAVEVVSGVGVALFATIFFVYDGPRIWAWVVSLFPSGAGIHVDEAGTRSWDSLSGYARGTVLIAAIDAVGIGLGVWLIGVPLAGAIAVLVFFFSFIPIVGALVSGIVAVLIALATKGLTAALLVLAVVILVQQLEGQVLQPLIQGKLVSLHPLAVVLAVAGGSLLAGLVGAVIAVPVVAVANVLVRYAADVRRGDLEGPPHRAGADPGRPPVPAG